MKEQYYARSDFPSSPPRQNYALEANNFSNNNNNNFPPRTAGRDNYADRIGYPVNSYRDEQSPLDDKQPGPAWSGYIGDQPQIITQQSFYNDDRALTLAYNGIELPPQHFEHSVNSGLEFEANLESSSFSQQLPQLPHSGSLKQNANHSPHDPPASVCFPFLYISFSLRTRNAITYSCMPLL